MREFELSCFRIVACLLGIHSADEFNFHLKTRCLLFCHDEIWPQETVVVGRAANWCNSQTIMHVGYRVLLRCLDAMREASFA